MAERSLLLFLLALAPASPETNLEHMTNSIGMEFVQVPTGIFRMGFEGKPLSKNLAGKSWRTRGDFDEAPAHDVTISQPFFLGLTEVTNAQYERFDPSHRRLRGKLGFSRQDHEAVVFVCWQDARRFCQWLSRKEGKPYRLPTEAEWEYACRAGTTSPFHTGARLPYAFRKNARQSWFPDPAHRSSQEVRPLTVAKTPPNPWGLYDMHGNVEEWCLDWYGPYPSSPQTGPVGWERGDFRVTRGGSHSTDIFFLRSANRSGALPEDRSWLIGFRVVQSKMPETLPLAKALRKRPSPPAGRRRLSQRTVDLTRPFFEGPWRFVRISSGRDSPVFFRHDSHPALTCCPNGDLLAVWKSSNDPEGRESALRFSRLPAGSDEWAPPAVFWDTPDRSDDGPVLWSDDTGQIYHLSGVSAAGTRGNLAVLLRTSRDSGYTWSRARLVLPEHRYDQTPAGSLLRLKNGLSLLPCYAGTGKDDGTQFYRSKDLHTWEKCLGEAAGNQAALVELAGGRLLSFGSGAGMRGQMPQSISNDTARSWTSSGSPFQQLRYDQRPALLRLREGPILLVSFGRNFMIRNASGKKRPVSGLFAALSLDQGETWPFLRLISDDCPGRRIETLDGKFCHISYKEAEPRGQLSLCQDRKGLIHLVSSRQYYAFNLAWLKQLPPARARPADRAALPTGEYLACKYFLSHRPESSSTWRIVQRGPQALVKAVGDRTELFVTERQVLRWVNSGADGFAAVNPERGFSVDIRLQVSRSLPERGVELDAYVGDGSASGNRYAISITPDAIYWLGDDLRYQQIRGTLNNHAGLHSFRLAVRRDEVVQIYRDGQFLAARHPSHSVDATLLPDGPYIQAGVSRRGNELRAVIQSIGFDLSGPLQPKGD